MKRAHVFIQGKVQGVGFRYFTKTNAKQIGVNGWVKNLPDGRVEAIFEGSEEQVDKMIELCRRGPHSGQVSNMDVNIKKSDHRFDDFRVKYY